MSSSTKPKVEPWKRVVAIFGGLAMAPIFGLMIGIFLISAIPVLLLIPWMAFPHDDGPPPAPPHAFTKVAHHHA
jgi:hypothetical protein